MFRLAHISDVHLGPLPALTFLELFSKRITGFVNWHRNRRRHLFTNTLDLVLDDIERQAPDHLAITGDLVNLASRLEIAAVKHWLPEAGTPENVSLVPGNHDAYVRGAYEKSTRAWYPYMRGDNGPAEWNEDFHVFPYMRVRGQVAIIGCSTAVATPPFAASGYFGSRQARETVNLLRAAEKAGLFRVLGHPARVRIVELLRGGERSVGALQVELGLESGATSQHLAALRRVGLVESRRDGTSVFYRVPDERVFELLEAGRAIIARQLAEQQAMLRELEPS